MRSFSLLVAALASTSAAQSLVDVLKGNNQTSELATVIGQFPSLVSALSNATNITVLAPSNSAIDALVNGPLGPTFAGDADFAQAVLSYHVLQGTYQASEILASTAPLFLKTLLMPGNFSNVTGGQNLEATAAPPNVTFISGLEAMSNVVQADVNFTGGVVHVIDSVLTLPANVSTTAVAANLTALAGALSAANLVDTVESLADITVFAPNNQAFENIGSALPNLTTQQLTDILTYHVVDAGVVFSTQLTNGEQIPTVNGANLTITIEGDNFFVNGAQIIKPNVLIENGVVHVIDNVLNPANASATPGPSASSGSPQFSGASSASIGITSGVPTPTSAMGSTTSAPAYGSGSASGASSSAPATFTGAAAPMITAAYPIAGLLAAGAAFIV